jgi:hypothetical protein
MWPSSTKILLLEPRAGQRKFEYRVKTALEDITNKLERTRPKLKYSKVCERSQKRQSLFLSSKPPWKLRSSILSLRSTAAVKNAKYQLDIEYGTLRDLLGRKLWGREDCAGRCHDCGGAYTTDNQFEMRIE